MTSTDPKDYYVQRNVIGNIGGGWDLIYMDREVCTIPDTVLDLLIRIHNGDDTAWGEFAGGKEMKKWAKERLGCYPE